VGSVGLGIIGDQEDWGIALTVRDLKRRETKNMMCVHYRALSPSSSLKENQNSRSSESKEVNV